VEGEAKEEEPVEGAAVLENLQVEVGKEAGVMVERERGMWMKSWEARKKVGM
jgi:hypothetical protein